MCMYGVITSGNIAAAATYQIRYIAVIISGRKKICLLDRKFVKDSESGLRVLSAIYFEIFDVFSAFLEAALLGTTLGKALKMSI